MATLKLEVVMPDKTVVSADVESVVCPGVVGEFGVLPNHVSLLSALSIGDLRYKVNGQDSVIKRKIWYEGKPQFVYEIADQAYEKPIFIKGLRYLGNHLSKEEGVIGLYLRLNKDYVPSIQVRYAAPMTEAKLWKMMNEDPWTITYGKDDVREEKARMKFDHPGISYKWEK